MVLDNEKYIQLVQRKQEQFSQIIANKFNLINNLSEKTYESKHQYLAAAVTRGEDISKYEGITDADLKIVEEIHLDTNERLTKLASGIYKPAFTTKEDLKILEISAEEIMQIVITKEDFYKLVNGEI